MGKQKIQWLLVILVGVVAVLDFLGNSYDWIDNFFWYDTPLHILGGVFVGVLFVYLFTIRRRLLPGVSFLTFLFLGVGFVMIFGVLWEFYEFFSNVVILKRYTAFNFPVYFYADTLKDLANDFIGGIIAVTILRRKIPVAEPPTIANVSSAGIEPALRD